MWMTIRSMTKHIQDSLNDEGIDISFHQYIILKVLYYYEDIIQNDLAEMMDQDKSSVMRMLKDLENDLLIARIADPDDRRRNLLILTDNGVRLVENARMAEEKSMKTVLKNIDKNDLKNMKFQL